jgi:hypothetical protein
LLTYALGRGVEARDMPTVRQIVHQSATKQYKLSAIIKGIIESEQFQKISVPVEDPKVGSR